VQHLHRQAQHAGAHVEETARQGREDVDLRGRAAHAAVAGKKAAKKK
jgi:hypothetical protein